MRPPPRGSRAYERYDWNSLLGDDAETRALQPEFMDGTSYFPSRPEMEANLAAFAERGARHGPLRLPLDGDAAARTARTGAGSWSRRPTATYRAEALIVAVGVAEPYTPPGPGMELRRHYADVRAGRDATPASACSSSASRTPGSSWPTACCRGRASWCSLRRRRRACRSRPARWSASGRGTCSRTRTTCSAAAWPSSTRRSSASSRCRAATGPLRSTCGAPTAAAILRSRSTRSSRRPGSSARSWTCPTSASRRSVPAGCPAQTPWWESTTVPGLFFAGTIGQGAKGLQRHGQPSNSGAVHGARYNARLLAGSSRDDPVRGRAAASVRRGRATSWTS